MENLKTSKNADLRKLVDVMIPLIDKTTYVSVDDQSTDNKLLLERLILLEVVYIPVIKNWKRKIKVQDKRKRLCRDIGVGLVIIMVILFFIPIVFVTTLPLRMFVFQCIVIGLVFIIAFYIFILDCRKSNYNKKIIETATAIAEEVYAP